MLSQLSEKEKGEINHCQSIVQDVLLKKFLSLSLMFRLVVERIAFSFIPVCMFKLST